MPYLRLKTRFINIDLELKNKYYLVEGFSGSGKSLFITELNEELSLGRSLETDLKIEIMFNMKSISDLGDDVLDSGALFVSDEQFAPALLHKVSGHRCYCLVITRKRYKDFNFEKSSLLVAKRDEEGITRIQKKYKSKFKKTDTYNCISE